MTPQKARVDGREEGWTWHQGGRKWHYYRSCRALCGRMLILVHPSEGYQLGNNGSPDNCAACKRIIAAFGER